MRYDLIKIRDGNIIFIYLLIKLNLSIGAVFDQMVGFGGEKKASQAHCGLGWRVTGPSIWAALGLQLGCNFRPQVLMRSFEHQHMANAFMAVFGGLQLNHGGWRIRIQAQQVFDIGFGGNLII